MTHRLPTLRSRWSLVSGGAPLHDTHDFAALIARTPPVLDWDPGPEGRPLPRWNPRSAA